MNPADSLFLLLCSYVADMIFGDPEQFPHPVRAIGKLIEFLESRLNKHFGSAKIQRIRGVIFTLAVVSISAGSVYLLLVLIGKISSFLRDILIIYFGYAALSTRDLLVKGQNVLKALKDEDLLLARKNLSMIVGRDTQELDRNKIIFASIESLSENTNDGIVAPLFYLALGGPVLAMVYKAINTLDSMTGYKNERFFYFGWASAKLDDIVNFIPARISGFLICFSGFLFGRGFRYSFQVMLRDGRKHPSPNSGVSEAAMAGALRIRLGGPASYHGKIVYKDYIGEEKGPVGDYLINEASKIVLLASLLMFFLGMVIRWKI